MIGVRSCEKSVLPRCDDRERISVEKCMPVTPVVDGSYASLLPLRDLGQPRSAITTMTARITAANISLFSFAMPQASHVDDDIVDQPRIAQSCRDRKQHFSLDAFDFVQRLRVICRCVLDLGDERFCREV